MLWHLSHRAAKSAAALADRHYSRQSPGSRQFVKPGRCLVLRAPGALWVTSWPFAEYVKHDWAGAWECSLFRNESPQLVSALIRAAVAATRAHFGDPPALGLVSFIDPRKVRPVVVHGLPTFGFSWRKAGFRYGGTTRAGLLAFQLLPDAMPPAELPHGVTPSLYAGPPR